MFIFKITGSCPRCNSIDSFGVSFINGNLLTKRCTQCRHQLVTKLPEINKIILYLDQCFLSSLYRKDDPKIMHAGKKILSLMRYQQIVTPYADIHETESLQWGDNNRHQLFEFIKSLARGHRFNLASEIKKHQLYRALKSYLNGQPHSIAIEESDAISSNIHQWDNYIHISTKISMENPEETSEIKRDYAQQLIANFPTWRDQHLSHNELRNQEIAGEARLLIQLMYDSINRWISPDPCAFLSSPQMGEVMLLLFHVIKDHAPNDDPLVILSKFLNSDHFCNVPYIYIAASIYSKFRQQVQKGSYSNAEKAKDKFQGLSHDVGFISVFAPYCDAIYLDNAMRQWLSEKDIMFDKKFKTKLFSKSNISVFSEWLDQIESSITVDIRQIADEIYP